MDAPRSLVRDRDGTEAAIATDIVDPKRVVVELKNGRRLLVPRSALLWDENAGYSVNFSFDGLEEAPSTDGKAYVIPLSRERPAFETKEGEHKVVRLEKRIEERDEVVEAVATINELEIERVLINEIVEEPPEIRHEGNTIVLPLVEEVLVVEKKLLLREEVHIRQVSREEVRHETVRLRSEYVEAHRFPGQSDNAEWPLNAEDFVLLRDGNAEFQESAQVPEVHPARQRLEEVISKADLL
ncbi:MAG TPA: DUF2382 domain-containing protein [Fimbriimonas sp.]|nr:DUF2382 domain-containing protein [Fimbriimonas sp.]